MNVKIPLSLVACLGPAAALLAFSAPQDTKLNEHELQGCEVVIGPVGQRKPPLTVWFEEVPMPNFGATFNLTIAKTGLAYAANPVDPLTPTGKAMLVYGTETRLLFKWDSASKAFDIDVYENGNLVKTWQDTPARGTLDPHGLFDGVSTQVIRHPADSRKTAMRITFKNYGLQGEFLLADQ